MEKEHYLLWILVAVGIIAVASAKLFKPGSTAFSTLGSHGLSMNAPGLTGMPTLPVGVVKYSQVPKPPKTFTADTIPKGLLKQHNTKAGTWGIIDVRRGRLEYQINEPERLVFELQAPAKGVIEPRVLHQVKALTNDVEFVVEFYRMPGTGPVNEKREGL
mmetsp:Transcript_44666/g.82846  ORF Transcript_44666/g.82846 Transcript_44666/m.82846 type:complete len:160 (-) Transcript_44666:315-794(-)|eukprot:CAMPEP_0197440358 /NCGR_PEP_ID=MMETSP1175-20131217/6888_1 /TAXON_ID=1003142 /ORGANISM="Triceratium dubium, Strain CCMP147" /LENGTH=159 /DNA_ID=CAMNT_0042970441 /DNA_START=192 /DNA_END=671 /DNA_ORIENTATION=-